MNRCAVSENKWLKPNCKVFPLYRFAFLLTSIKTKYSEKLISCQNGGTNISWLDILLSNLDLFRDHVSKLLIVKDSLDYQLSLDIVRGWVENSTNYLFTFANTSHWSCSTIGILPQNSSKFEKRIYVLHKINDDSCKILIILRN